MSTNTELTGPIAVLKVPRTNLALIIFAKAVHDHMEGNSSFPDPQPALGDFATNIAALADAEAKAASGGKGAAKLRNARKKKVRDDLKHLLHYVQTVADAQPTAADAIAVIESAFLSVRTVTKRNKPPLEARNAAISGTVALDAAAIDKLATYFWQHSLDQKTWTSAAETMKAKAQIEGLTAGQTYYFRFRALTRAGAVDFSQVVSLMVR